MTTAKITMNSTQFALQNNKNILYCTYRDIVTTNNTIQVTTQKAGLSSGGGLPRFSF